MNKSFCELINCPGKDNYHLEDFHCIWMEGPAYECIYLDPKGKSRKEAESYTNDRLRAEIQIIAALIKSKNG